MLFHGHPTVYYLDAPQLGRVQTINSQVLHELWE
jgi:hypothetical protein